MPQNVTFVPSFDNLVFYPIGNTPAVDFLSLEPPIVDGDGTTEILSLACGDPRSILYSLWCAGEPSKYLNIMDSWYELKFWAEGGRKYHFEVCIDLFWYFTKILILTKLVYYSKPNS